MARVKIPAIRIHKPTGQAYIFANNRRVYLGKAGTSQALEKYHKLSAEIAANGGRLPVAPDEILLKELTDRYLEYCDTYYRTPDGRHSSEYTSVRLTIKAANQHYGDDPAADFGPLALRTVREKWIGDGLKRTTINRRTAILVRMFRWGVAHEIVATESWQALQAVEGLRKGRSLAKESTPVTPVPDAHIEAIRPHVSRQVWGLVQLQLLTGARSGEILGLRRIDLDTSGTIWATRLDHHKTSHRGKARTLYFGERAQAVLREFFPGKGPTDFLFDPRDAVKERRHETAEKDKHRRENQKPSPRKTDRTIGDRYTVSSYRRAVARACIAADVPDWHPHQLRHTAGTRIRKQMGLEAAQVWLGHSDANVTQVYAEVDHARALEIAAQMG